MRTFSGVWRWKLGWAVASCALVAAVLSPSANAADILVTSTAGGSTTIDGNCTLWEAIAAAKGNSAVDACAAGEEGAPDVVNVPAGTFSWDFSMAILSGVGGPVVIRGAPGNIVLLQSVIQIVTKSPLRFLRLIDGADVTLENLDIRGGDVTGDPNNEKGGSILVDQVAAVALTLSNVVISGSRAILGGAIYFSTQGGGSGPRRLRIQDSAIIGNVADFGLAPGSPRGGAIYLELHDATEATIVASGIGGNTARTAAHDWDVYGAGLFADLRGQSSLELRGLQISDNRAESAASGTGHAGNAGATIVATDDSSVRLVDLFFLRNYLDGQIAHDGASALGMASAGSATVAADRIRFFPDRSFSPNFALVYQHLSTVPARLSNLAFFSDQLREAKLEAFASEIVLKSSTSANGWETALDVECHPGGSVRVLNTLLSGSLRNVGCLPLDASSIVNAPQSYFVNFTSGDLRLAAGSPPINAGADEFAEGLRLDPHHQMRIAGAHVDVGAYEFGSTFGDDFESAGTTFWSSTSP